MVEILDCPPEILDLIVDELVLSNTTSTSELRYSEHQRLSRRILPLGLTCRSFYQFILPRFYSNCFLEFRKLFDGIEDPRYGLYDSSVSGTVQKYNGFFRNGTLVKTLNIRVYDQLILVLVPQPTDWETEVLPEFREVSQSIPNVLGKLVPRFDNLKRAEFQRSIGPNGSFRLGDFVKGIHMVLSQVTSLTALDLSIQWNIKALEGWTEGIETNYSSFYSRLHELSISIEPKLPDGGWDAPTEEDIRGCLWFMDILVDLLQLPSRTVKILNFESILDGFEDWRVGRPWMNSGVAVKNIGKQLEFPFVEKLNLTRGGGCQSVYEQYFKVTHGAVKDLSLHLIALPGGAWEKEIYFMKSFPNLTVLTLSHPRDTKPIEAVVASLPQLTRLKELTVFLFESAPQVEAIMDKFGKDSRIQIKKSTSAFGFVTISLHF